jgi:NAD kinase
VLSAADRHDERAMNSPAKAIAFVSADTKDAREAATRLVERHGQAPIDEADTIVALGGDGFLLQTLRDDEQRQARLRDEPRHGRFPDE